jgi:hypothetical protein
MQCGTRHSSDLGITGKKKDQAEGGGRKKRFEVNSWKIGRIGVKSVANGNPITVGLIAIPGMHAADKMFMVATFDRGEKFCSSPAPTVERLRDKWWTESPLGEWINEMNGLYRKKQTSRRQTSRRKELESARGSAVCEAGSALFIWSLQLNWRAGRGQGDVQLEVLHRTGVDKSASALSSIPAMHFLWMTEKASRRNGHRSLGSCGRKSERLRRASSKPLAV